MGPWLITAVVCVPDTEEEDVGWKVWHCPRAALRAIICGAGHRDVGPGSDGEQSWAKKGGGREREGQDPPLRKEGTVGSMGCYPKPTCDDGLDDAPFILQPPCQHGLGRP